LTPDCIITTIATAEGIEINSYFRSKIAKIQRDYKLESNGFIYTRTPSHVSITLHGENESLEIPCPEDNYEYEHFDQYLEFINKLK